LWVPPPCVATARLPTWAAPFILSLGTTFPKTRRVSAAFYPKRLSLNLSARCNPSAL
jgi:hypothetical protein